jgi:hypothetical protein
MNSSTRELGGLGREDKARLAMDMMHRIIMHHVLWFTEVRHQMGTEQALVALWEALESSQKIQLKRLSKTLGFGMTDGIPDALLALSDEKMGDLLESISLNWLAGDGVWFQAVEFAHGMNDAKRCNDSCWAHFSPFEASAVKRFLGLSEKPGLEGLKAALKFRMYARINEQSIVDEEENSFVFQMNKCRVQAARQRKNLDDYPCKSAGLVEYPSFAQAIDPRIKTECIGCPPDAHPQEWYCAWKFSMEPDEPCHA